jgi:ankyrin repeat protein
MVDLFSDGDINLQNKNGDTPLHISCRDNPELAKYLVLKYNADSSLKNNLGDSPLEIAKRAQNLDLVMVLNQVSPVKRIRRPPLP